LAQKKALANPKQFSEIIQALFQQDPATWLLVDKQHPLSPDYYPNDLMQLDGVSDLIVNKKGMELRKPVLIALQAMVIAAKKAGIRLDISSAFRDWQYQKNLFQRYVNQHGEAQASRFSARPGTSQHQLGTAIDFGSVSAAFANTKAGQWLANSALDYGFSLSYPEGLEATTGYMYESWHYRWVGLAGAQLIRQYFGGIQQHALEWLHISAPKIQSLTTLNGTSKWNY
jgi:D-alanyl-D-alanine carboxypeptidase